MKTKFDVDQKVYFINSSGRVEDGTIYSMLIRSSGFQNSLYMGPSDTKGIHESRCFETKAELIDSL